MHKIQERPVAIDGKVEIRPMMYLALSYDHRVVDGKEAVTFLIKIKEALENPAETLSRLRKSLRRLGILTALCSCKAVPPLTGCLAAVFRASSQRLGWRIASLVCASSSSLQLRLPA